MTNEYPNPYASPAPLDWKQVTPEEAKPQGPQLELSAVTCSRLRLTSWILWAAAVVFLFYAFITISRVGVSFWFYRENYWESGGMFLISNLVSLFIGVCWLLLAGSLWQFSQQLGGLAAQPGGRFSADDLEQVIAWLGKTALALGFLMLVQFVSNGVFFLLASYS
ncbi:hypothetical protein [Lignipirellula cremea]|uniref:Uncharacterized protein n=1 Tax=Lignipirellula cremea TaxID=2528010 RepID=A0A518DW16_9BACT|nr:hypothetical protein [Lignipirellula cremea]QDU96027.1 hypothetical protein Pla8534_38460 [Lignipirellula cremea]